MNKLTLSSVNDKKIWDDLLNRCQRVDLSQTWEIGLAMQQCFGWIPCRKIILYKRQPVAIVQVLAKKSILGGIVKINGGPLFIKTNNPIIPNLTIQIICFLHRYWVEQQEMILTITPCIMADEIDLAQLTEIGFKRVCTSPWDPWSSIKVELLLNDATLLKNMKGNWRRALNKAQKQNLIIARSYSDEGFTSMLKEYECNNKGSVYPSPVFLEALRNASENSKTIQIIFAKKAQQMIGGVFNIGYGNTCYQLIAWNSSVGKRYDSHRLLIWESIRLSRKIGYQWYDLGGVNDIIRPGVAQFKRGSGGCEFTYIGNFESVPLKLLPIFLSKFIWMRRNIYNNS